MTIVPEGVVQPFRHAPARLSTDEAETVKQQVIEWVEQGVVRQSTSNIASESGTGKKEG